MWIALVLVAVVVALVAVVGLHPRGGKQVANTQMMTMARVVLGVAAVVILYFAYR